MPPRFTITITNTPDTTQLFKSISDSSIQHSNPILSIFALNPTATYRTRFFVKADKMAGQFTLKVSKNSATDKRTTTGKTQTRASRIVLGPSKIGPPSWIPLSQVSSHRRPLPHLRQPGRHRAHRHHPTNQQEPQSDFSTLTILCRNPQRNQTMDLKTSASNTQRSVFSTCL